MPAALAGEALVGAGTVVRVGQPDQFAFAYPREVVPVQLLQQHPLQPPPRCACLARRGGRPEIGQFVRIRSQVEDLGAVAGRVVDQLEAPVMHHTAGEAVFPKLPVEPRARRIRQRGASFHTVGNGDAGQAK